MAVVELWAPSRLVPLHLLLQLYPAATKLMERMKNWSTGNVCNSVGGVVALSDFSHCCCHEHQQGLPPAILLKSLPG